MAKPAPYRSLLNLHFIVLSLAIVAYALPVIFFRPQATNTYHFSNFQVIILTVTLMVPWVATWVFGVMGYLRLLRYGKVIQDNAEARPFKLLAWGVMVLVWSLILATLVSSLRSRFLDVHPLVVSTTIVLNYLYALAPLLGFYLIWKAIRLLGYGKIALKRLKLPAILVGLGLAVVVAGHISLVFTNPDRQIAPSNIMPATYYLPDWLIVLTVVLPVVLSWALGVLAVAGMYQYKREVPGFIYKRFMRILSHGIILIVLGSIFLQGIQSLGPQRLLSSGLQSILLLLYIFLFVQLAGYLLVNHSAKRLTIIEKA